MSSDQPVQPDRVAHARSLVSRHPFAMLGVGFLAGALVIGIGSSCDESEPHAGHDAQAPAAGRAAEATTWTCSMHPQVRQPEPGQCPICGMDLIPASSSGAPASDDPSHIALSDRAKVLAELRTTAVRRYTEGSAALRLLGRVEPDETTRKTITAWTGGRIDRLHVNVTGERVRAGQVIATLYSPEVFSAHQDLLVAKGQVDRLSGGVESARMAARAALEAARERLRLLGVPDDELARMETASRPTRSVAIRTPFGGTVIERLATEGAYITTGAPLYRIADLRTLWIQLDAYESDLRRLALGQTVQVAVNALPSERFEGKITFIDPTIDPERRTARVRVELDNRDGKLKPGMFVEAVVAAETAEGEGAPLVIPATAPLLTGRRALVYVEIKDGEGVTTYEARTVRLGPRLGSFYPVVAGLTEGERVVSRGAFAIDADLQIRGGTSMMTLPDDRQAGPWDSAIEVPRAELVKLGAIVEGYLEVQRALAADDRVAAQKAAAAMEPHLAETELERPAEAKVAWDEISRRLRGSVRHVVQASSIEHARTGFEGLSDAMAVLLRRFGNPLDQPLVVAECPMAFGSRGASWVQQGEEIDNAYLGESMRTCGTVEQRVAPGAHLAAAEKPAEGTPSHSAASAGHVH